MATTLADPMERWSAALQAGEMVVKLVDRTAVLKVALTAESLEWKWVGQMADQMDWSWADWMGG